MSACYTIRGQSGRHYGRFATWADAFNSRNALNARRLLCEGFSYIVETDPGPEASAALAALIPARADVGGQ